MEPYKNLALIYDQLIGDLVFEHWCQYFEELVKHHHLKYESAADAACGTGSVVKYWADKGLRTIFGTDYSASMLKIAREKNEGNQARFFEQDLVHFTVPENVDLITCNFASLNYLDNPDNLGQAFAQFYAHLKPHGYLICDLNSIYFLQNIWGNKTHYLHNDEAYTIWVTSWDEHKRQGTLFIDNFIKSDNGLFAHSKEVHIQKGYEPEEIIQLMRSGGFEKIEILDLVTLKPITPKTARYLLIAPKPKSK